jgi:transcriptional regulator with XRE-family HTH domain
LNLDGSLKWKVTAVLQQAEVDAATAPALRFGAELRRWRIRRGWSQVALSKHMKYSNTLISYIEGGKRPPTMKFAVKADEVFESGGVFYELWERFSRAALLEGVAEFVDAESRCHRLRTFEMGVIPGLFQVPEYTQALATAAVRRGSITSDQARERVAFLADRQQRMFERKQPAVVHAVMDESCIARTIGGPKVMSNQLDRLAELAELPNVTIQVAPFSLGERRPFTLPIVLLTMPDRSVLGYSESQMRGYLERAREPVSNWERDYDQLQVESLSTSASVAAIRAVRKDLEHASA